jgi:2Fe-2S ferredoxin
LININVKDHDGQLHEVQGKENESLMEALREYEWGVAAVCGGLLSCGTCHVYLEGEWSGKFPETDPEEQDLLSEFDACRDNSRLSCQLMLQSSHDGLQLSIAPDE